MKAAKPTVKRTKRTDHILEFRQKYTGDVHESQLVFNRAFAGVLRSMADALEKIDNQWAHPEFSVWMGFPQEGLITAELMMSEPVKKKKTKKK